MARLRISELLKKKSTPTRQLSLYWLARAARVSYPTVHKLATKEVNRVDLDILDRISDVLECETGDLFVKRWRKKG